MNFILLQLINCWSKRVERFAKYLADEETYTFDEPIQFESKNEVLSFSARIGYGVDERIPIERLLLRSFKEYDNCLRSNCRLIKMK